MADEEIIKNDQFGFWQNREIILKSNVTLKLCPRGRLL